MTNVVNLIASGSSICFSCAETASHPKALFRRSGESQTPMSEAEPPSHPEIREAVRRLCADFPGEYWQRLDRDRIYPAEFVRTLTEAGFLSILIPEQYGGAGPGPGAATAGPEEIHRLGLKGGGIGRAHGLNPH